MAKPKHRPGESVRHNETGATGISKGLNGNGMLVVETNRLDGDGKVEAGELVAWDPHKVGNGPTGGLLP